MVRATFTQLHPQIQNANLLAVRAHRWSSGFVTAPLGLKEVLPAVASAYSGSVYTPVIPPRVLVQRALSFEPWHFAIAGDYIYSRERTTDDDAAYQDGKYGGVEAGNDEEKPSSSTDLVPSQTARIFYVP